MGYIKCQRKARDCYANVKHRMCFFHLDSVPPLNAPPPFLPIHTHTDTLWERLRGLGGKSKCQLHCLTLLKTEVGLIVLKVHQTRGRWHCCRVPLQDNLSHRLWESNRAEKHQLKYLTYCNGRCVFLLTALIFVWESEKQLHQMFDHDGETLQCLTGKKNLNISFYSYTLCRNRWSANLMSKHRWKIKWTSSLFVWSQKCFQHWLCTGNLSDSKQTN